MVFGYAVRVSKCGAFCVVCMYKPQYFQWFLLCKADSLYCWFRTQKARSHLLTARFDETALFLDDEEDVFQGIQMFHVSFLIDFIQRECNGNAQ